MYWWVLKDLGKLEMWVGEMVVKIVFVLGEWDGDFCLRYLVIFFGIFGFVGFGFWKYWVYLGKFVFIYEVWFWGWWVLWGVSNSLWRLEDIFWY